MQTTTSAVTASARWRSESAPSAFRINPPIRTHPRASCVCAMENRQQSTRELLSINVLYRRVHGPSIVTTCALAIQYTVFKASCRLELSFAPWKTSGLRECFGLATRLSRPSESTTPRSRPRSLVIIATTTTAFCEMGPRNKPRAFTTSFYKCVRLLRTRS